MKKKIVILAVSVLLCVSMLTGCFSLLVLAGMAGAESEMEEETHTHTYGDTEYTVDLDKREKVAKQECSCGHENVTSEDMSTEDIAEYLKERCQTYTFEEIARYPEEHKGELAVFTGEVSQVVEGSNSTTLLVSITKEGEYFSYYTDSVYVEYEFSDVLKVLEGDVITMYGELQGEKTYRTVLGASRTIPLITVYYAELQTED